MAAVSRRAQTNGHGRHEREQEVVQKDGHDLDDLHAALLQTFIAKRVIHSRDTESILTTLADATDNEIQPSQDEFEEIVAQINVALADFDLEIRKCLVQATGQPLWAIVNTTSDSFLQLATTHSLSEIAYLRALLNAMFDTSNSVHEEIYAIRSTDAVNLSSSQGVALTKTAGEAAIDAFIREGWLEKSRAGFITLSPRGLLELRGYLLEMFSDEGEEGDARTDKIKSCHVCAEIVTQGIRCGSLHCPIRFHKHCADSFFTPRNNACPTCKTPWSEHLPVGEAACSDRSRRRVSDRHRQREETDESPEPEGNGRRVSPSSRSSRTLQRSRSPTGRSSATLQANSRRSSGRASPVDQRGSRRNSRRTSAAQSIQEEEEAEEEEEDLYE